MARKIGKKYKKNKSNRKTRRKRTKRVYKRRASFRKRKVKRRTRRRRSPKRRRRLQKGGVQLGKCNNPFQGSAVVNGVRNGNYYPPEPITRIGSELTRQGRGMKGGGSMWRDLGLSKPKDFYNDTMDFLGNIKNTYMGNRKDSTSNVMNQPIRNTHVYKSDGSTLKQSHSRSSVDVIGDYNKHFTAADTEAATAVETALASTDNTDNP